MIGAVLCCSCQHSVARSFSLSLLERSVLLSVFMLVLMIGVAAVVAAATTTRQKVATKTKHD